MLMRKLKTFLNLLKNSRRGIPVAIISNLSRLGLTKCIPDKIYLKILFRFSLGYKLDLKNPKTYNEKLQWLKLYDRRKEYIDFVDKYRVREHIKNTIGEEYLIPILGCWDNADEISIDDLPDQFVLKCNHDSGSVIICKDKKSFDLDSAKKQLNNALKHNLFWWGREWPYKNVKPCIIAEKYMVDESGYELKDYKFFCFNGAPQVMFIATDRQVVGEDTKFDFYDMEFNHLPFTNGHPNSLKDIHCPETFDKMKELASMLSKNIPQVRVDFYDIEGKIYFGEMTFFHWSGLIPFEPIEWDYKMGDFIELPNKRK